MYSLKLTWLCLPKLRILQLALIILLTHSSFSQSVFYSKASGDLNQLATWGVNTDGTGTSPANFSAAGRTYIITNRSTATIGAAWAVSGAGSRVQLGEGLAGIEFIIPSAFAFNGTIDVTNAGTLSILHTTNPTLGNLDAGSLVNYGGAGNQTVLNATYYDLTLSGGGQKSLANTANTGITNMLTINGGVIFRLHTVTTLSVTLTGSITGSGAILGNASSILLVNGTGDAGTLTFTTTLTLYQLILQRSGGTIELGSNLTVTNAFIQDQGTLDLGGRSLTLNGTITFPAIASNGLIRGSSTSTMIIGTSASLISNSLFMDQTNASTRSLSRLTFNRANDTLILGNDLIASGAFTQTNGLIDLNGNHFTIGGVLTFPATAAAGSILGSPSSSLSLEGTGTITNSLKISANVNNATFSSFVLNRSGGTALTLGANLYCQDQFTHSGGVLALAGTSLSLNGAITFPASASNGSMTGSATSSLFIGGSGSITNSLIMSQANTAARTLNSLVMNRPGATASFGNPLIVNTYEQVNGNVALGSLLTLNARVIFPASYTNGYFTGSPSASLVIPTNTALVSNALHMDQTNQNSATLSQLSFNRTGQTLTLSTNLNVSNVYAQTNGNIDLNGNSLVLSGTITFPSAFTNGYFIGSSSSSLSIEGNGAVTNTLKFDQTSTSTRSLSHFRVNRTGGTVVLGGSLICAGNFTHDNGVISLAANELSLNGPITFPLSASNGSFTGALTSTLIISGAGAISNNLYMSQASATTRNLDRLIVNRPGQTLGLGNAVIVNTYSHTAGNVSLNSSLLTFNGLITFPTSSLNGYFIGSSTASIAIAASTTEITYPFCMDPSNSLSRTLSRFSISRVNDTLQLGTDLTVSGAFVQTNGIINLNDRQLELDGVITFPAALTNGFMIGSATSSLSVTGSGAITNALRLDQSTALTANLNRLFINCAGTLLLGNNISCSGPYIHNTGVLSIGATQLTLNSSITFPASAANGSVSGSASSSLHITGSGSITNFLQMNQASAAARTLGMLLLNRPGQTLGLGNALIVTTYSQTSGRMNLNGTLLTLNGAITFPSSSANGDVTGSLTSSLVINASAAAITYPLFMDQTSAASRSLSRLGFSRVGDTLALGSDLTVNGAFVQTAGILELNAQHLDLNGDITFPNTLANGYMIGSTSSSLSISGSGLITNALRFDQSATFNNHLNRFVLNFSGTLALGNSLNCSGPFIHTSGILSVGASSLALNGDVTFPLTASNGMITGSGTSSLSIAGSGSIVNSLWMNQATAASRTFNSFLLNRSAQAIVLGNDLIVNTLNHANGDISINGMLLTLNGALTFPASATDGGFTGSLTSSLTIAGSGAITNSMKMNQAGSATRSLYNLSLSRTGQTLNLGNDLEIINSVVPTLGTIATNGSLTLKADANRSAMLGVVGGAITGNLRVETFAPGGFTGWTLMGTSGQTGLTVANWESQFPMTCFSCPYNEYSTGGYFVSIQAYNEALAGSSAYIPLSYSSGLTRGVGYWVYLGSGPMNTSSYNIQTTGPAATGNVLIPVTNSNNSGFNLVANPYPAPIDWDLVAIDLSNINISGAVYFYNPDLAQYVSYAAGISNPSGYIANGVIPRGQGFYVQALLAGNITFRESHKSNENTSANPLLKGSPTDSTSSLLRLFIQGSNDDYDETAVRLHKDATGGFDRLLDARKIFETPGYIGTAAQFSKYTTLSSFDGSEYYSINSLPFGTGNDLSIPILAKAQSNGTYTIGVTDPSYIENFECVSLKDRLLKIEHDLSAGAYTCTISDTTSSPRFELRLCNPKPLGTSKTTSHDNLVSIRKISTGIVKVTTNFSTEISSDIAVYNLSGQKILSRHLPGSERSVLLDLGNHRDQIVVVRVTNSLGQTVQKIYVD